MHVHTSLTLFFIDGLLKSQESKSKFKSLSDEIAVVGIQSTALSYSLVPDN